MTTVDPIAEYVVVLRRALHGSAPHPPVHGRRGARRPRRRRGRLPRRGRGTRAAAVLAVRDFGPVAEVAPEFQDELTALRGRWAAILLAVVFPAMLFGWDLLWKAARCAANPVSPPTRCGSWRYGRTS